MLFLMGGFIVLAIVLGCCANREEKRCEDYVHFHDVELVHGR